MEKWLPVTIPIPFVAYGYLKSRWLSKFPVGRLVCWWSPRPMFCLQRKESTSVEYKQLEILPTWMAQIDGTRTYLNIPYMEHMGILILPSLKLTAVRTWKSMVGSDETAFWGPACFSGATVNALRLLGMSWGVKTTCLEAPGVSLGGSGVSIGGVGSLRVEEIRLTSWGW